MLTLWLSIIVLAPFEIKEGDQNESLFKRIIEKAFDQVLSQAKLLQFSSVLLGKILSRPDVVQGGHTAEFLKKATTTYTASKEVPSEMGRVSRVL